MRFAAPCTWAASPMARRLRALQLRLIAIVAARSCRLWRSSWGITSPRRRHLKEARDWAANAAGLRIDTVALTGNQHVSREEVLAIAGITGTTSLLFLDVEQARERLKSNPWIADATVLKLYPRRAADQHQGTRGLRALAEGWSGLRHCR